MIFDNDIHVFRQKDLISPQWRSFTTWRSTPELRSPPPVAGWSWEPRFRFSGRFSPRWNSVRVVGSRWWSFSRTKTRPLWGRPSTNWHTSNLDSPSFKVHITLILGSWCTFQLILDPEKVNSLLARLRETTRDRSSRRIQSDSQPREVGPSQSQGQGSGECPGTEFFNTGKVIGSLEETDTKI